MPTSSAMECITLCMRIFCCSVSCQLGIDDMDASLLAEYSPSCVHKNQMARRVRTERETIGSLGSGQLAVLVVVVTGSIQSYIMPIATIGKNKHHQFTIYNLLRYTKKQKSIAA